MIHKTPDGEWKTYQVGTILHIAFRRDGEKLWKSLCDHLGGGFENETMPGNGLPMHAECACEAKKRGWI